MEKDGRPGAGIPTANVEMPAKPGTRTDHSLPAANATMKSRARPEAKIAKAISPTGTTSNA